MKIKRAVLIVCYTFLFISGIQSRDINLDNIYIKSGSTLYKKILQKKIEVYQTIGSRYVDSNIIFADWVNGNEIIYIKELPKINIIYLYNRRQDRRLEITRQAGSITIAKMSSNGKYLFMKRLVLRKSEIPDGEILLLNIRTRHIKTKVASYPFLDFSLSPGGNSIIYEGRDGIIELFPESNIKRLISARSLYSDIVSTQSPTISYLSPNRQKILIINGTGGSYKSRIITDNGSWRINGITSATEIFWLNDRELVYRKGGLWNFSVYINDTKTRRIKKVAHGSLNTNISYSKHPGILSFLQDQIIHIYNTKNNDLINTGLEGEDICFSPDGNRFTSLLCKKLFITNINLLKKRYMEIRKASKTIFYLYRDVNRNSRYWANEYSSKYIKRKIAAYKALAFGK